MPADISETLNQDWVKEYLAQPLNARLATCDPRADNLIIRLTPERVCAW